MTLAAQRCPYGGATELMPVDPCQDYLTLREDGGIRRDDDLGVWIVTGFEQVERLLRNPSLSSAWPERGRSLLHGDDGGRTADVVRRWFMFADDPRHGLLRGLVAPGFSPNAIERLRPFVEAVVTELLDGVTDEFDVMTDLAEPLSSRVVCRLLGLPETVAPRMVAWSLDIAALMVADYLPAVVERGTRALGEISEVVAAVAVPGRGSLLEVLRTAVAEGAVDARDVEATASLMVFAGFETTSTFIGKAVRALLHAGRWGIGTAAVGALVEELLRFDTSVQQLGRVAVAPIEVAGHRIEPGELVVLLIGVANRDPVVFPEPDALEAGRPPRRHLGFGFGPHYCVGAGLARLEVGTVLEQMVRRWPHVEQAAPPVLRRHFGVTVLEHLRLSVRQEGP